jgi:hypothetical protein
MFWDVTLLLYNILNFELRIKRYVFLKFKHILGKDIDL